jgi:hypothetical protein
MQQIGVIVFQAGDCDEIEGHGVPFCAAATRRVALRGLLAMIGVVWR